MKIYALDTHVWLRQDIERVFDFFADARNLEVLTPPWLHFALLTPDPIEMRVGVRLDYRLRLRGVPIRWQSEISVWEPPSRFVDRQTQGPYSLWIHEHRFEKRDGGTLVRDNVQYAVPGGKLVQKLLVAPDLERIFNYRHRVLEKLLAGKRTAV